MLFPRLAAETKVTDERPSWPLSAGPPRTTSLLTRQPLLEAESPRGWRSEFPIETWDPGQAGTLLEHVTGQGFSPGEKTQVSETAAVGSVLSRQCRGSCGVGDRVATSPGS